MLGWEDPRLYPEPAQAAALLAERGLRRSSIDWLLKQPEGPLWAVRWLVWIDHCRNLKSLRDVLYSTLRRAIVDRIPEDREPPSAFLDWLEERNRWGKRQARTAAVVASRPDPFQAQKAAPKPSPSTAVLPELSDVWAALRQVTKMTVRPHLEAATAVLLDGNTLVIEVPTLTNVQQLQGSRDLLLELARDHHPELVGVRFETSGGR